MDWLERDAMRKRRNLVVNNVRFLVRDHSPNLANKALALAKAKAVGALPGPWREKYGYESLVAETFTDPGTHQGTFYKAADWTPLGLTEKVRMPGKIEAIKIRGSWCGWERGTEAERAAANALGGVAEMVARIRARK